MMTWRVVTMRKVLFVAVLLNAASGSVPMGNGAVYPMYTPGEPITAEMRPTPESAYGLPRKVQFCSDLPSTSWRKCAFSSNDDSFCYNRPSNVSRTPQILGTFWDADKWGRVYIVCGAEEGITMYPAYKNQGAPPGTKIVYTTNGTLPDIYGARHANPVSYLVINNQDAHDQEGFIVARCLEPNKMPSRIAYVQRKENALGSCAGTDPWRIEIDHKPLILPGCNALLLGTDVCDGQTIVPQRVVAPPPPQPNNDPTSPPGFDAGDQRSDGSSGGRAYPTAPWLLLMACCAVFPGSCT
ncbi:MAG: hypothetical protein LC650_01195 [Actinobacteria bacterium]|nr:hypothetical protein [Actinomycetota bacterium]